MPDHVRVLVALWACGLARAGDVNHQDAVREERERAAESARVAREGRAKLEEIRVVRAAIDKSASRAAQAAGWMRLNEMAKDLAGLLGGDERQKSLAEEASALGVAITLCEPSGLWAEGNQGYEKYLELTPNGPKADIAWWKGRVESSCGDGEGTADEYRWAIDTYSAFLRRFPKSQFAAEARAVVKDSREGLKRQLNLDRKK